MSSRRKRAKQQPKRRKLIIPAAFLIVVFTLVGLLGFGAIGAYAVVQSWINPSTMPSIDDANAFNVAQKSRIYAADGSLLGEFYAQDREPVTADQVSSNVFNATVDIEDERFWEHNGVDYYGIARAVVNDLTGGDLQGASTITQQFVRQTLLQNEASESTLKRKVREADLAIEMEKKYSKQDILMMYLNTINYGDGAWGIQSAAQHYFSKDASDLTIPEAALIAGIPQNPTYNNPVTYPDNALTRRNMVLDRMYVNGHITAEQRDEYKSEDLGLNLKTTSSDGIYKYPYFTSYVRYVLLNNMEQYGINADAVFKGGLEVYTTLDPKIEDYAEQACAEKEASLLDQTGDPDIEVSLACVDPNTGYIVAMRGGKDYYADQFNTCWQMQRQAGSTFKVFALTAAIEEGYSPSTPVSGASPVDIDPGDGGPVWHVENYGGEQLGNLTMQSATWLSSNTAYARIVKKIGSENLIDMAHRMGITTELPDNLSVVLGADGVNTLEMASAFGTLGVGGVHHEPTCFTKILDKDGNVIYDQSQHEDGTQAVTPEVANAATQVLEGVVTGGTGVRANLGWQVSAGKTGTTDNYWDSWFVGYTPQLSCAVWIGDRAYPQPIQDNVGGDNCCPVWKEFMDNALDGQQAQDFPYAASPVYDPKATFLSAAEQKAIDDAAKKKAADDAAKKKAAEDAAKKKAADDAAKQAADEAAKQAADDAAKQQNGTDDNSGSGSGGTGTGTGTGTGDNSGTGSGGSGGSGSGGSSGDTSGTSGDTGSGDTGSGGGSP